MPLAWLVVVVGRTAAGGPAGAEALPPMLAPDVGAGQLAVDTSKPPHSPTLPAGLDVAGASYWGLYKICVDKDARIASVEVVKSAGAGAAAGLDNHWVATIKRWQYKPYLVSGVPSPFCYTARLQAGQRATSPAGAVMVAPNIGSGLLLTDVTKSPHKPKLPDDLNRRGNVLWGLYKVCVSDAGQVHSVKTIKSADASVDDTWMALIKTWRYRPYTIDHKAIPFCYTLRLQVQAI